MTGIERTIIEVLAILALVGGFAYYEQHKGAKACIQAEAVKVAQVEVHNAQVEAVGRIADAKTETKYDDALHAPVGALPPVTGLQPQACGNVLPQTRPHPSKGPGTTPVRVEPPPSVVPESWDSFERSDVSDGKDADARVIYLQGLLANQYKLCTSVSK